MDGSVTSSVSNTGILQGSGTITGNVSGGGTFSPGDAPGTMTINGNFTPTGTVNFEVDSPYATAGSDYDQYIVSGSVDLSGATLTFTNISDTTAPAANSVLTLISKTSSGATTPSPSPAQGTTVTIGSRHFDLFYNGGDGNDVVLADATTPTTVAVNPAYATLNNGQVSSGVVGGVNAFATLQAAVNAAASGATINVAAGTYAESVTITKPLTLQGAGVTSILDASGLTTGLHITSGGVSVSGFKIKGNSSTGQAVWIDASGGSLAGDSLTGLTITGGATNVANDGIRVDRGATTNSITGLTITGDSINGIGDSPGYGLFLDGVTGGTYSNNIFANLANDASYPSASNPTNVAISTAGVGVFVQNSSGVTIDNTNTYSNLTLGGYFAPTTTTSSFSATAGDFSGVGGYYVNGNSPSNTMAVTGLTQSLSTNDVAPGTGANLSPLGNVPNLFASIQTAVDFSLAGATVTATAGTYTLAANLSLYKSITLDGPNVGNSPRNGGLSRVAEAVINGGAPGSFTGSSGYNIVLAAGLSTLTVSGFKFTNFDGNLFASTSPLTSVDLHQDLFDTNNGGLFYKFDTTLATTFNVTDNRITNQSMTGANEALFFLGDVASSHFDTNEASNVSSRELFNIYFSLTSTTFDSNKLTSTAGLAFLAANENNVTFDSNTITTTNTAAGVAPSTSAPTTATQSPTWPSPTTSSRP